MDTLNPPSAADLFGHVRAVIAVMLGLSIGRLLQGLASVVEQRRRAEVSMVHLAWVVWAILSVIGFWWWEFHLIRMPRWTFGIYIFLFVYAASYFMVCATLFPDNIETYDDFGHYFLSRRKWFFAFVALVFALDIADTLLKGPAHLQALGASYFLRTAIMFATSAIGWVSTHPQVQAALVIVALITQIAFFFTFYDTLT